MFYGHMKNQSKTKQNKKVIMYCWKQCLGVESCSNFEYQIVVLLHEWESAILY